MQIINVLNKAEFDSFRRGEMLQVIGTNPMIAYDSGRVSPAVRYHGKSYPCPKCSRICTTPQALGGHLAAHARHKKLLTHHQKGSP